MTGRDLVTASLRLIGASAPGESLAAAEATDGLAALNRMLGSFSNEGLLIHAQVRETLTLTASDGSYTIGSSGNLNTTRPIKVDEALIRDGSSEYLLRILSLEEWASIAVKDVDGLPHSIYFDGAYPLLVANLYPRPSSSYTLVLFSQKPLTEIATLDTEISLPPGYDEMLTYNLSMRLGPEYGRPVPAEVMQIAIESKASIKRTNSRPVYLRCDSAVTGRGAYNILTGGYE